MLKLIKCEFLKLKRKPLVFISLLLSVFMPLAYAFFLADVNTDVDAVNGVMSSLFQLSAYLLLMPLLVILASNLLFEELDNDTLKNLVTIPINRTKLVLSKMLVLLLFAVGFMAVGGLVNLAVLLFQGWEPVGFWTLFGVGIEEGLIMWVGALPCILLVVLLNKNYIVSVVITFFYTTANYILSMSDAFLTQPFGLNIGTLFPGPLAFRWTFQFYDQSQTSAELADLLERISPYFLNGVQVFGVIVGETALFLIMSDTDATFNFLISMIYTQLFNLLCEKADDVYGGRLPVHVRCLIDEMANIGQIPNLEKLVATIRSREISACLVLQAQSQLKAIYKDNADTIIL